VAGIAAYVKSLYPKVRIVGVEPEDAASMHDSLLAGERVTLARVGIFADGVPCVASARRPSASRSSTWMR